MVRAAHTHAAAPSAPFPGLCLAALGAATSCFNLPPNRVVELGSRIEI
jgi:hypothetical protein